MNKKELTALVAEILGAMGTEPMVKGSDYKPTSPGPQPQDGGFREGDFVADVSQLPPLAPRVIQCAAMQADAVLEWLFTGKLEPLL